MTIPITREGIACVLFDLAEPCLRVGAARPVGRLPH